MKVQNTRCSHRFLGQPQPHELIVDIIRTSQHSEISSLLPFTQQVPGYCLSGSQVDTDSLPPKELAVLIEEEGSLEWKEDLLKCRKIITLGMWPYKMHYISVDFVPNTIRFLPQFY